jgi:hypothetical protein
MTRYWVYFIGTRNGEHIVAPTMHAAKMLFAEKHGIISLAYVKASKRTR